MESRTEPSTLTDFKIRKLISPIYTYKFPCQIIVQGNRKNRKHRLRKHKDFKRKWRRQKQNQPNSIPIVDQLTNGNETLHRRSKRSISSPRHVEALVVADSSMVTFHQDDYIETYLLTIMNMVSSLYKDPAIGNLIKVVVVRIVMLEDDESHPDFNITHVAENNLQNFCR